MKRKMRTKAEVRLIKREMKKLDLLRTKKAKGLLLNVEEKLDLYELSYKFWTRNPLENGIKKRKTVELKEPLYGGTIVEVVEDGFQATFIWNKKETILEVTKNQDETKEAIRELHLKFLKNEKRVHQSPFSQSREASIYKGVSFDDAKGKWVAKF